MSDTASEIDALAQRLRNTLAAHAAVREVRMFGGLSFMVSEKLAVAARRNGDLLVHVDPASYDQLLQRGAMPAVMGTGRPMGRRWMSVPQQILADDAELDFWVNVGVESSC